MSEENNPAEDFLLEIDQETKERAAAEQYKKKPQTTCSKDVQ